ncbi:MAG: hypothetical protein JEZ08_14165 [Clostridiales bacterium]|nr:hypothetical protein [Clostridiales bacterium]
MLKHFIVLWILILMYNLLANYSYNPYDLAVNSIGFKSLYLHRLHKKITYSTHGKQFAEKLNIYNFLYISCLLFIFGWIISFAYTELVLPSFVLGFILSMIPNLIIDSISQYSNSELSLEVAKFISILTRWSVIKEDIYYCFEKSIDQIEVPLKLYISDFMMHVKYSGHIGYAFDIIIDQTHNEMLRNLMINLQQTTYSKGDLVELLERLEEESYQIYGEHERRKTETHFDKIAIYFSIISVLILTVTVLLINTQMQEFYLHTTAGQYLLSFFSILFFLGIYVSTRITSFNY